jgi:hypothetical protein
MEETRTVIDMMDNGGRRRVRDRRFLVSAPRGRERRTHWERRSGYDRRLRRITEHPADRRFAEIKQPAGR